MSTPLQWFINFTMRRSNDENKIYMCYLLDNLLPRDVIENDIAPLLFQTNEKFFWISEDEYALECYNLPHLFENNPIHSKTTYKNNQIIREVYFEPYVYYSKWLTNYFTANFKNNKLHGLSQKYLIDYRQKTQTLKESFYYEEGLLIQKFQC